MLIFLDFQESRPECSSDIYAQRYNVNIESWNISIETFLACVITSTRKSLIHFISQTGISIFYGFFKCSARRTIFRKAPYFLESYHQKCKCYRLLFNSFPMKLVINNQPVLRVCMWNEDHRKLQVLFPLVIGCYHRPRNKYQFRNVLNFKCAPLAEKVANRSGQHTDGGSQCSRLPDF